MISQKSLDLLVVTINQSCMTCLPRHFAATVTMDSWVVGQLSFWYTVYEVCISLSIARIVTVEDV
jgi:hypothetical protein